MKWIGLTGGIGTGKSTAAKYLRDFGVAVIDADELARQVVKKNSPGLRAILELFGPEILTPSGELNRSHLGKIVFSDAKKRADLERILHPLIQELKAKEKVRLDKEGHLIAFYDVPLLFEKNLQNDFEATVLVTCDPEIQRERLKNRDQLTDQEIEQRVKAQMPLSEKMKLATYVILNNGSLAELKNNVAQVLSEINNN
jgi:dephospho-CoA kinase